MTKRIKIGLLCAAIVLVTLFARIEYSKSRANVVRVLVSTKTLQSVDIGNYSNKQDGWNAMIIELDRQTILHPKTNQFEIVWRIPMKGEEYHSQYERRGKTFFNKPYVIVPWSFQMRFPFFRRGNLMYVGPNALTTS